MENKKITPRKELFIAIKKALMEIPELELIDLDRGQMSSEHFPHLFVSALINIKQEGRAEVEVTLYCRDGWANQHQYSKDFVEGLNEIDLLDKIAEKLQFLYGEQFKALEQTEDETQSQTMDGIFAYTQRFSTKIYRKLAPKYTLIKIKLKNL